MNRSYVFLLLLILLSVVGISTKASLTSSATSSAPDLTIEQKIDSLLGKMTPEEKFGQLNQLAGNYSKDDPDAEQVPEEQVQLVKKGLVGSFLNVVGAEATRKIQRIAVEESRLGIPLMFAFDVIHGYRTIFPIPIAEASTWDPDLLEQSAHVAAVEASAAGLHWTFAPMVDIARDARWGRITEGAGEDPYLGSVIATARVRGFQGRRLGEPGSVLACAKHFAAYGGAEGGRDYNTVDISERTLREIYFPPFKAAVKAGVRTLMSSFNEVAGIPSTANRKLLTTILRDEWNFRGLVVSDWTSIAELQAHGIAGSRAEAGMLALNAGVDVDMESRIYFELLPGLLRQKRISEPKLDEAVRRVLRAKFELGLFENPYRNCDSQRERQLILHPDHRSLARKVAERSIVLLKNEKNVLPLQKSLRTIAVLGPLADDRNEPIGSWEASGQAKDVVTVLEGIQKKLPPDAKLLYQKGCEIQGDCGPALSDAERLASQSDVAIVVVGEAASMSGEAASRSNIDLPGNQEQLVRAVYRTGKPVVVVLMNGRPLAIPWIAEHVPAVLEAWFLGIETGNAIADVLFGDVNPSAKLPVTFPRNTGQIPIYYNHKNTGRPPTGDKWTSKYIDVPDTPLYPFGFGLSYTTFKFAQLQITPTKIKTGEKVIASVDLTNTGQRTGEEVVQLYIQDEVASVTRPVKELKAFRRVSLSPGEKKKVQFTISPDELAFYNVEMKRVIEPGKFAVFVGPNSQDVLKAEFELLQP
jgi:beta-glucosidase